MSNERTDLLSQIQTILKTNGNLNERLQQATSTLSNEHQKISHLNEKCSKLTAENAHLKKERDEALEKANNDVYTAEQLEVSKIVKETQAGTKKIIQDAHDQADTIIAEAHRKAIAESDRIKENAEKQARAAEQRAKDANDAYELTTIKLRQLRAVLTDLLNGKSFDAAVKDTNSNKDLQSNTSDISKIDDDEIHKNSVVSESDKVSSQLNDLLAGINPNAIGSSISHDID